MKKVNVDLYMRTRSSWFYFNERNFKDVLTLHIQIFNNVFNAVAKIDNDKNKKRCDICAILARSLSSNTFGSMLSKYNQKNGNNISNDNKDPKIREVRVS